jgi:hypothetical protein
VSERDVHKELSKQGIEIAGIGKVPQTNVTGLRPDGSASLEKVRQLINIRPCTNEYRAIPQSGKLTLLNTIVRY